MTAVARRIQIHSSINTRRIVLRTRGQAHGPITRLASPSDVGELIKPFVFLDYFEADPAQSPNFGWHPHSGIATLTLLLQGETRYEETTGVAGILSTGGIEWMRAGAGVWHTGGAVGAERIKGFQLWLALPPDQENGPTASHYLSAAEVHSAGPARVVLGQYGGTASAISAPPGINYLDVRLRAGERWSYQPPPGHTVAWIAVHHGELRIAADTADTLLTRQDTPAVLTDDSPVRNGEMAVFDETEAAVQFVANIDTGFVLGSAVKHPHDLVLGYYSVHTNRAALIRGEAEIERIGARLRAGTLR